MSTKTIKKEPTTYPFDWNKHKDKITLLDKEKLKKVKNKIFNLAPGCSLLIARKIERIPFVITKEMESIDLINRETKKKDATYQRAQFRATGPIFKIHGPAIIEREAQSQKIEENDSVYIDPSNKCLLNGDVPVIYTNEKGAISSATLCTTFQTLLNLELYDKLDTFSKFFFSAIKENKDKKGHEYYKDYSDDIKLFDNKDSGKTLSLGNLHSELIEKIQAKNGSILKLHKEGFSLENFTGIEISIKFLSNPYDPDKIKDWFINNFQ